MLIAELRLSMTLTPTLLVDVTIFIVCYVAPHVFKEM